MIQQYMEPRGKWGGRWNGMYIERYLFKGNVQTAEKEHL